MQCLLVALLAAPGLALTTPIFDSTTASEPGSVTGLTLIERRYLPYDGSGVTAFGFGGAEQSAYDPEEFMAYAVSEQNYVTVVDMTTFEIVTGWPIDGTATSAKVCGGKFFVAGGAEVVTDDGQVFIFETVKRGDTEPPKMISAVTVGPLPDMIIPNRACTMLAVGNEGEADEQDGKLVDPVGSVDLIEDLDASEPKVTRVSFEGIAPTDESLLAKGVDMLLTKNAMIFYNDNSAAFSDQLDWTSAIESYTPDTQLEPEYMAWSGDDKTLYVNCQENSAIVMVDAATKEATGIYAMGPKEWSARGLPIDTVDDGQCKLEEKVGFVSMRMPDSIAAVNIDGQDFIIFAEEGDDYGYGAFEDKQKFADVVASETTFTEDFAEFVAGEGMADGWANFGSVDDSTKMRVSLGTRGVDYSDPTAPVFKAAVGYGGRGMSIYKADATSMEWVWDSGSEFEANICELYPWAFNGIQDEEFALNRAPGGFLYDSLPKDDGLRETIDEMNDPEEDGCDDSGDGMPGACPTGQTVDERSLKDGPSAEAMTVGVACGRLLAVTAQEKGGVIFAYDITDPTAAVMVAHGHASPASETKSPEVAGVGDGGELGDIDTESIIFIEADHSPTGNAGILVAGAWSSTLSWWEFECKSTGCVDSDAWFKKGDESKTCDWVKDKPDTRCGAKGWNKAKASYMCPGACSTACDDDATWHKNRDEAKTCAWVSVYPKKRCDAKGVGADGPATGAEACPIACSM